MSAVDLQGGGAPPVVPGSDFAAQNMEARTGEWAEWYAIGGGAGGAIDVDVDADIDAAAAAAAECPPVDLGTVLVTLQEAGLETVDPKVFEERLRAVQQAAAQRCAHGEFRVVVFYHCTSEPNARSIVNDGFNTAAPPKHGALFSRGCTPPRIYGCPGTTAVNMYGSSVVVSVAVVRWVVRVMGQQPEGYLDSLAKMGAAVDMVVAFVSPTSFTQLVVLPECVVPIACGFPDTLAAMPPRLLAQGGDVALRVADWLSCTGGAGLMSFSPGDEGFDNVLPPALDAVPAELAVESCGLAPNGQVWFKYQGTTSNVPHGVRARGTVDMFRLLCPVASWLTFNVLHVGREWARVSFSCLLDRFVVVRNVEALQLMPPASPACRGTRPFSTPSTASAALLPASAALLPASAASVPASTSPSTATAVGAIVGFGTGSAVALAKGPAVPATAASTIAAVGGPIISTAGPGVSASGPSASGAGTCGVGARASGKRKGACAGARAGALGWPAPATLALPRWKQPSHQPAGKAHVPGPVQGPAQAKARAVGQSAAALLYKFSLKFAVVAETGGIASSGAVPVKARNVRASFQLTCCRWLLAQLGTKHSYYKDVEACIQVWTALQAAHPGQDMLRCQIVTLHYPDAVRGATVHTHLSQGVKQGKRALARLHKVMQEFPWAEPHVRRCMNHWHMQLARLPLPAAPATSLAVVPAMSLATAPATTLATASATTLATAPATTPAVFSATSLAVAPATTPAVFPATTPAVFPATSLATDPATLLATAPATSLATDPATSLATAPATTPAVFSATTPATASATTHVKRKAPEV